MREPSSLLPFTTNWRGEVLLPPLDEAECKPVIIKEPATPAPPGAAPGSGWGCALTGVVVFSALVLGVIIWGVWSDAKAMEGY